MKQTMSLATRKELLKNLVLRYQTAKRVEKQQILSEFIAVTNYHRKYAMTLLQQPNNGAGTTLRLRKRKSFYTTEVKEALITIWNASNRLCSKRLIPFLPDFIKSLEQHGHLVLLAEVRTKLLSISTATMDRMLRDVRQPGRRRYFGTTRGGPLIKQQIAIRTFSDWDNPKPGFMEADLVAHCGTSVQGTFLNTLVLTDVSTGWTECFALLLRSHDSVIKALHQAPELLPFPLLGLDTDNGSEFINGELLRYCREEQITFTRCRPYKKNDQCYVEQKNGAIVRHFVGYDRFEGAEACKELAALYGILRLIVNFFQPSLKLISKQRIGSRVIKKYDKAQTPFQRLLACEDIPLSVKAALQEEYYKLDPIELQRALMRRQDIFWQYAHRPANGPAQNLTKLSTISLDQENRDSAAIERQLPVNDKQEGVRNYRITRKSVRQSLVPRYWRTRKDIFVLVNDFIEQELAQNLSLEAKSLLQILQCNYPGQFHDGQLRTLQRRVKEWRAVRNLCCEGVILPQIIIPTEN